MSYLEFISEAVTALAWPIATVVVVLIMRSDIASLLARIKNIKHKGSEIDLAQEVVEAKLSADKIPDFGEKKAEIEQVRIERLAKDSPRGAILDAWLSVDEAMINYSKRYGIDGANCNVPPYIKIDNIRTVNLDHSTLGNGIIEMLDKLRRIRDDVVHKTDAEITPKTAIEYASLAARVKAKLEEA